MLQRDLGCVFSACRDFRLASWHDFRLASWHPEAVRKRLMAEAWSEAQAQQGIVVSQGVQ